MTISLQGLNFAAIFFLFKHFIMTKEEVKLITVKIICGDEQGTGFFITPTRILTAYHVVMDEESDILISNDNLSLSAKLISFDKDLDIALLCVDEVQDLPVITYSNTKSFENNWTLGYINDNLCCIEGSLTERFSVISLQVENGQRDNYNGLSGAAMMSNGKFIGLVHVQIVGKEIVLLPMTEILIFFINNAL